jgi:hypothetical protein
VKFSAPLPGNKEASQHGKGVKGSESVPQTSSRVQIPQRRKDFTVRSTAGGYFDAQSAEIKKLSPKAKCNGITKVLAPSMEAPRITPILDHQVTCPVNEASRILAPITAPK